MIITSVQNEKIKRIKKLKNNKDILKEGKFIVEGEHLVIEAKKAGLLIETFSLKEDDYGALNTVVTESVLSSISSLSTVPSVIGICKLIPEKKVTSDKIMILDGVSDPGNLGTIIRSAKAFGFNDIVLGETCVKKYNEKVIRATQGMLFNTNIITRNLTKFIIELKELGYDVYATEVTDGIDIKDIKKKDKVAIIMGSEGLGVSKEVKDLIDKNIYIKIDSDCESLNVGVAASIIMYELSK